MKDEFAEIRRLLSDASKNRFELGVIRRRTRTDLSILGVDLNSNVYKNVMSFAFYIGDRCGRTALRGERSSGRDITQFRPGDAVFGACITDRQASGAKVWVQRQGSFADYVCGGIPAFQGLRGRRRNVDMVL